MKAKLLSLAAASLICGSVAEAKFYLGIEGGYTAGAGILNPVSLGKSNEVKFVSSSISSISNAFKTDKKTVGTGGLLEAEPYQGYSVGINFGSEHLFLRDYLGLRWGVGVGYTSVSGKYTSIDRANGDIGAKLEAKYSFLDTNLSFDLLVNFYSSHSFGIGVFGGAELGYHYMLSGKYDDKLWNRSGDLQDLIPSKHSLDLVGRVGITSLIAEHHRIDLTAKLPIGSIMAGKASDVKIGESLSRTSFSAGYKYIF